VAAGGGGPALWAVALIGGVIYPSAVQSLVVNPNQKDKEAKYIAYNIEATRHALGIDDVTVEQVEFGDLTRSELSDNVAALRDVRLLKPEGKMVTRFQTEKATPARPSTTSTPIATWSTARCARSSSARASSTSIRWATSRGRARTSSTRTVAAW
jgi:hypothetical protein